LRTLHRHRAEADRRARHHPDRPRRQTERALRPGHRPPRMSPSRHPVALLGAALIVAAAVMPFMLSGFRLFQFTQVFIYAIALLGLNILTGYNGQISLGHGAFYALGAYTGAIMMDRWNVPFLLTLPVAGALCLGAGFLFGIPALRLEGLYLALATFSLALAVPQILKYFEHWTGGAPGIRLSKPPPPLPPRPPPGPRRLLR